mgnify:CR=1 FL=1
MKAVSDGTKTKLEVLEASLRQMRECFLDVSIKISFEFKMRTSFEFKISKFARFCIRYKLLVSKPISVHALLTFCFCIGAFYAKTSFQEFVI